MKLNSIALIMSGILAISGCGGSSGNKSELPPEIIPPVVNHSNPTANAENIALNDMAVHDPSIVRADDGTYYVFGSHLAAAKSTDLMTWARVSDEVNDANPLFNTYATEVAEGIEWTGGHVGSWAADVIQLNDGKYYFYYNHCTSPTSGLCDAPRSYLGVAVADTIEGPYEDLGIFLRSGMTPEEIEAGFGPEGVASFDAAVMPNAIDPNTFYDKNGKLWMVYGSYSGGIFILEMDEVTAKPLPGQGYGTHLVGGNHSAIEGTWITYNPVSDYYYMFNSFGGYEAADGYNIRISRSRTPDGPYLDAEGRDMAGARGNWDSISPYGVKMMGGFEFVQGLGEDIPGRGYLAPGHNSAYYDAATGKHLLVTHTRFPNRGQEHSVRVHEMFVNAEGWLVASPHRYVPISGTNVVDADDLVGTYKFINHQKDINRAAHESVYINLTANRTITGEVTGYYRLHDADPARITVYLAGIAEPFEGVMAWQWDEMAGKLVPTFTALHELGISIWGTQIDDKTTADVLSDVADALTVVPTIKDGSVDLPARGTRATEIVWTSSNTSVIRTDGTVIRPNVGDGNQLVTLTATMTLDGEVTTKSFDVMVPQRQTFNRIAHFGFENNLMESLGNFAAATATGDRIWTEGTVGYAAGQQGQAVQLNGASGVLLPEGLISNYEYTVSFWANPTVINGFTTAFFGAVNEQIDEVSGNPFSTNWISYLPQSWDGNTMLWSGSEAWFDGSAGERIPENTWSHMAFSVNKGLVSVYINGVQKFSGGNLTDFFSANQGKFALGVNYWDLPYNGLIDELKVYEASLSASEVKALDIDRLPSSELLASATDILALGDLSAVRTDLTLPVTGPYAAAISWASSNPSVVSTSGAVTQPGRESTDIDVTLTATLMLDGEQTTKEFVVTVKSLAPPIPVAVFGFEDSLDDTQGTFGAGNVVGPMLAAGGQVSYSEGAVGNALVLDGASGVKLPNNLITDHTYTIAMWLKPNSVAQFGTTFFGWASDSSWISVVPRGPGDAQNTMLWSGTAWFDGSFGSKIPIGSWSHLVMVVNSGSLNLYLNGELAATLANFPNVFTPAATRQFALGVNLFPDAPFNGMIDELKIYDEGITLEDAQALFDEAMQ